MATPPRPDAPLRLDCASGFGAVTMVTATFGMSAAGWVLKKIVSSC